MLVAMTNRDVTVDNNNIRWFGCTIQAQGVYIPTTGTATSQANYLQKFVSYLTYDPQIFGIIPLTNSSYFTATLSPLLSSNYTILSITDIGNITDPNNDLVGFRNLKIEIQANANAPRVDINTAKNIIDLKIRMGSNCSQQRFILFPPKDEPTLGIEVLSQFSTAATGGTIDEYYTAYQAVYYQPFQYCPNQSGLTISAVTNGGLVAGEKNEFLLKANTNAFIPAGSYGVFMHSASNDVVEEILPQAFVQYVDAFTLKIRIPALSLNGSTFNPGSGFVGLVYDGERIYTSNMVDIKYALRETNFKKFPSGLDNTGDLRNTVHAVAPVYTGCDNRVQTFQLHQNVIDAIPNAVAVFTSILADWSKLLKGNSSNPKYLVLDPTISNTLVNDNDPAPVLNKILIYLGGSIPITAVMATALSIDSVNTVLQSGVAQPRGFVKSGVIRINTLFSNQFYVSTTSPYNQWIENGKHNFYITALHEIGHALGLRHIIDATHANSLTYALDNRSALMYWMESAPYPCTFTSGRCDNGGVPCASSMTKRSIFHLRDRHYTQVAWFYNRNYGIINSNFLTLSNTPTFSGYKANICASNINPYNISGAFRPGGGLFSKGTINPQACNYIQSNGVFTHCGAGGYPIAYTVNGCKLENTLSVNACKGCVPANSILIDNGVTNMCLTTATTAEGYVDFEANIMSGSSCASSPSYTVFVIPTTSSFNYTSTPLAATTNTVTKRLYFTIPASFGTGNYQVRVVYNAGATSQILSNIWNFSLQRVAPNEACTIVGPQAPAPLQASPVNNTEQAVELEDVSKSIAAQIKEVEGKNIEIRNLNIRLYPNPTNNQITLEATDNNSDEPMLIDIFNLQGQRLSAIVMQGAKTIVLNTTELNNGFYLFYIQQGNYYNTYKVEVIH